MFDSFAQLFPAQWQAGVLLLLAPLRLLAEWQPTIISAMLVGHPASRLFMWVVLLVPVLLLAAVLVLTIWCAIEATIFTFTLQPTLVEVFGSLTGFDPNPRVMAPLLWAFLFLLVAGSFACVQVVTDAVKKKNIPTIVQMLVVESAVM